MAITRHTILDSNGNPVGMATCSGKTCFPALGEGQSLGPAIEDTAIVPQANTAPPPLAAVKPTLPTALPDAAQPRSPSVAVPTSGVAPSPLDPFLALNQGSAYVAPPSPVVPPPRPVAAGGDDPFANIPPYRDGSLHPAAGGLPRVPGGPFAQADDGYDNRQQVYVPDGAAAGPFETRSAYPTKGGSYGGQASGSAGGGGGPGGIAKDMYYRIKGEVEGKLMGMGPGGSSYESYDSGPSQKRLDRAYDRYYDEVNNPDPQQAHGWAKRNLGPNKGMYPAYLSNPELVAIKGLGLDPASNTARWTGEMPTADLAFITGGGRGMTRKTDVVKPPPILRAQGVRATKPENKRELDYSKYAKQVADVYRRFSAPDGAFTTGELMGDLAHARNSGALRQGIKAQAAYDPGGALDRVQDYFDSAFAATTDPNQARIYADMAQQQIATRAASTKKPKHIDRIIKRVAKDLMGG